ncbi:hypothetical protein Tco_1366218 [Tanacetum coccineum]
MACDESKKEWQRRVLKSVFRQRKVGRLAKGRCTKQHTGSMDILTAPVAMKDELTDRVNLAVAASVSILKVHKESNTWHTPSTSLENLAKLDRACVGSSADLFSYRALRIEKRILQPKRFISPKGLRLSSLSVFVAEFGGQDNILAKDARGPNGE